VVRGGGDAAGLSWEKGMRGEKLKQLAWKRMSAEAINIKREIEVQELYSDSDAPAEGIPKRFQRFLTPIFPEGGGA